LLVYTFEFLRPGCGWGSGFEVHPHETDFVDVYVDRKKAVLCLVEGGDSVEAWGFCQVAFEPVAPAVVFAVERAGLTRLLLDDRISTVPADVVETVDVALLVENKKEGEAGIIKGYIFASCRETEFVCYEYPFPREDGAAFKVVKR
jgi:hypothetical protein